MRRFNVIFTINRFDGYGRFGDRRVGKFSYMVKAQNCEDAICKEAINKLPFVLGGKSNVYADEISVREV